MNAPTISIGLCTFNGERFLREQLESIENQTLSPFEVVACDDRSTDKTLSMLEDFARRARFPVRIIQNEQRLGVSANFAKAVSECRGDYYAPCDQDDIWLPERLQTFSEFLTAKPSGLVFSDAFLIDDSSKNLNVTVWQKFAVRQRELDRIRSGRALEVLIDRTFVTGATMILSRDLLNVGFPLPPDLPPPIIQDAWLTLIAAARGELSAISKPLMFYRRHASQQAGVPVDPHPSFWSRILSGLRLSRLEREQRRRQHRQYLAEVTARAEKLGRLIAERVGSSGKWRSHWRGGLRHLQWRRRLPSNFVLRLIFVLFRMSVGTYFRYSARRLTDPVRDILYGGRHRDDVFTHL